MAEKYEKIEAFLLVTYTYLNALLDSICSHHSFTIYLSLSLVLCHECRDIDQHDQGKLDTLIYI